MIGRTEIAAMALQGLLANPDYSEHAAEEITTWAVEHADMLIEELTKIPPPAGTESPMEGPPSGCTAGAAGDTKGAASPRAAESETAVEPAPLRPGPQQASPVQVFDCEGRFPNDPPCVGTIAFDPATRGRFCATHIAVDEGSRREMHRLHGDRNRPAAKARRIADAIA